MTITEHRALDRLMCSFCPVESDAPRVFTSTIIIRSRPGDQFQKMKSRSVALNPVDESGRFCRTQRLKLRSRVFRCSGRVIVHKKSPPVASDHRSSVC